MSTPSSSTASLDSTLVDSPKVGDLSIKDIVVSADDKAAAAAFKDKANEAFKAANYPEAAKMYSFALEKNPLDPTLYCNRAFTRMRLEEQGYAILDCKKAIEIDPKYVKAYYRRGLCQLSIFKPHEAVKDFKKALALDPKNALAKTQLDATQKLIRRIEFEKAIDAGEQKSPVDRVLEILAEGGSEVPSDYTGPRLATGDDGTPKMTQEFIDQMTEYFKNGKLLHRRVVWDIVLAVHELVRAESTLNEAVIEDGVTCDVIGDVHGQYYDVLHLLSLTGTPSEKHALLFNGDFVDRGSWSMEVILTLFAYKVMAPAHMYGFQGECEKKHGELSYKLFTHVFCALPLATLVSATKPPATPVGKAILSPEGRKRFFVVHGGLFSKDGVTLDEIRAIDRHGKQPGNDGLMCELLWTDPQEENGRGPSKRGVGIAFGPDVTRSWCTLNGVTGILRSHEVRQDGYQIEHDGLCTTVFSAPNYVDQVGNKGAFVRIDAAGERQYIQFEAQPHPPMKPMAYASQFSQAMM
ncbi:phosphoprotein phosphatase [Auriculariales sp. MPI-PUGE-AT-0066]|nr:phosphoprotein phosphatase [Auriculariales sp. MPI-PUGE-AT-0066]